MRVNARLDQEIVPKIQYLSKTTGLHVSAIVKKSILLFYDQVRLQKAKPGKILMKSGFIGCGRADSGLSRNYKKEISKILNKKYDYR